MMEKAIEPIKVKYMSPEDRAKWQQMQQAKLDYQAEQRQKKELLE